MNILIVEDEFNAREALKKMIPLVYKKPHQIQALGSVEKAIVELKKSDPDVILLDIQLVDGNAFDILDQIENTPFKIVFISANPQFALDAIKHHPIDFLTKPLHPDALKNVLIQVEEEIINEKKYKEALQYFQKRKEHELSNNTISLKTNDAKYLIKLVDIVRLEAEGAYTRFITENKKLLVSKNLKHYELKINNKNFVRVHQSHLINLNKIESIEKSDKVLLKNGELIPISKRKRKIIKQFFN